MLNLAQHFASPVKITAIEVLRQGKKHFIRSTSADGVVGLASTNERLTYLLPLLKELIIPYFINKDARNLEALVDGVYTHRSNYKFAGMAFWNGVGHVEFSLLDLLGKTAGKSVGVLLGDVIRQDVPIYLSSLRRDTTPEQEVVWLAERLAETGAKAVKLKVGGRMSQNADAFPGRTKGLIPLARKTFGDDIIIYADANGSYDADKAIEVGQLLEAYEVGFFEEPCPFQDYEATKRVADALVMSVAGGEQDTSLPHFKWLIYNRAVDLVQPDLAYNGGFIRCLRVAQIAAMTNMQITPHSPKADANAAYMLHFASIVPNLGPYQEFRGQSQPSENWYTPSFTIQNGVVPVPTGPGLGIEYDSDWLAKAEIV